MKREFAAIPASSIPCCAALADAGIRPVDSLKHFPVDPGRGWARYHWVRAKADGTTESDTDHITGISTPMYDLSAFSSGNDFVPPEPYGSVVKNPARVGGKNIPINDQTLDAIRYTFETGRRKGCQIIPRFAYAQDAYAGCEPDDIEWILYHIRQLAAVVNEFADCVIGLECGTFGPWGEMHTSKYIAPEYANRIIGAWLENLNSSIPVLCRTPMYIANYVYGMTGKLVQKQPQGDDEPVYYTVDGDGTAGEILVKDLPLPEGHPARRLSLYDDGYMGTDTNWGTYVPEFTRSAGVALMIEQNHDKPYGGEFGHTHPDYLKSHGAPIYEDWFIKELYETKLSYLRNLKNAVWPEVEPLRPFGKESFGVQKELVRMPFDARFEFDGMPDVSCYYGQTMHKFLIDHIGYRLILRAAQITPAVKKGSAAVFSGTVENVGFGNVLGKFLSEILLETPCGEILVLPCDVDPGTFKTCEISAYKTAVAIPEDAPAGTYKAYLRFAMVPYGSNAPYAIPFANPDVYCEELTANYIGSFTVSE